MNGKRQKKPGFAGLGAEGRGEPSVGGDEGTETFVAKPPPQSPAYTEQLMEEVCNRENLERAWKRVRSNKGCYSACKIDPHMRGIGVQN